MKLKSITIILILGMVIVTIFNIGSFTKVEKQPTPSEPDLTDHPFYKNYVFGEVDSVIDFGIQPLWIPTSLFTEIIKRDVILQQILSEKGFELRFHPFFKGADVNFFLKRGELDMGIGGDMPALAIAAVYDVVIPALIQQGFCSIVAKKNMPLDQLRDKRIGYAYGSNAHYALLQALSHVDLNETDVHLIPLDVNEMPEALDAGRIDAFSAWEPTPTIALQKFKDQVVIHRSTSTGYLYFSQSLVEKYPVIVHHIIAAEIRAIRWMQAKRNNLLEASKWSITAAENFSGQDYDLSREQTTDLAMTDLIGVVISPYVPNVVLATGGALHREFIFLKGLDKIPAAIEWDKVRTRFDRDMIKEVTTNSEFYQLNQFLYENSK